MIIIEAIKYAALCWVVLGLTKHVATIGSIKFKWLRYIETICERCTTFWLTLAITWNPFVAALAAFLADLNSKYNNKIHL